jgi:TolA-binding protein
VSVVELHPEDLLDREADGGLSPEDASRLERHMAQCAACRLEHQSRRDFRTERDPLGPDFDVQRLLSEVLAPGADRELLRAAAAPRRAPIRRLRPLLLAAAALMVASVSAAAGWKGISMLGARPDLPTTGSIRASRPQEAHEELPAAARPPSPVVHPLPSLSPPPEPVVPVNVASASPLALSSAPGFAGSRLVAAEAHPVSLPPTAQASMASISAPLPPPAAAAAPSEVAALFEHANRARRSGDHARATELYRSLLQRYPASPEAHESLAVLGRELLGDGEATGALGYFDDYLRSGGSLREDVMADRALALGRLGRARDEAEAWGALLRAFPGSVHAERASLRLRELGVP